MPDRPDNLKKHITNPYSQIPNALIENPEITSKAKAVYCYLSSRPDNWVFYTKNIGDHIFEGKKAIRSALKELVKWGWITKKQLKTPQGLFLGNDIVIFDEQQHVDGSEPQSHPCAPYGTPANGTSPDGLHNNTDINNTNSNNTESNNIIGNDLFPENKKAPKTKRSKTEACKIEVWEEKNGRFNVRMLMKWGAENALDPQKIIPFIEVFRETCMAKGYQYVDFPAAFRSWVMKEGIEKYKLRKPITGGNNI